jgi:hypothetical protein
MSLSQSFAVPSGISPIPALPARPSPFSLRLSAAERARLLADAGDIPLGTYIKSRLLGGEVRTRRPRLSLEDKAALAKLLGLLGRSHIANNLNQLARAVNIGALPLTPETETEILEAARDVRAMRVLLLRALGLKAEADE